MKTPLWCLVVLLACLFTPGCSDCQGECVACGLLLQQQQQAFNTMVCLLACESQVSSSSSSPFTWELCKRALKLPQYPSLPEGGALSQRTGEELDLTPFDLDPDGELLQSAAVERFQDSAQDEGPFKQRSAQYDSSLLVSAEERESLRGLDLGLDDGERKEREEREVMRRSQLEGDENEDSGAVELSKRFGGFLRGRHGYRKLIGSPVRQLQKRYGGFIGIRKSARKWNSQKRVNQLLRQYLGMRSSRSGRFNSVPATGVWRPNQL
ncbi:prepronociceptin b [Diretmus argenteus]